MLWQLNQNQKQLKGHALVPAGRLAVEGTAQLAIAVRLLVTQAIAASAKALRVCSNVCLLILHTVISF